MGDRRNRFSSTPLLVAAFIAATLAACGASGTAAGPAASAAATPAPPSASVPPTKAPAATPAATTTATAAGDAGRVLPSISPRPWLPDGWAPATAADVALVDRIADIWTKREAGALTNVYDPGMRFASSWDGVLAGGLDGVREYLGVTINSYQRASDVASTTADVPGLPALPAGNRWLSYVMVIHGTLIDSIMQVDPAGMVVLHLADEHAEPDVRAQDGYPALAGLGL